MHEGSSSTLWVPRRILRGCEAAPTTFAMGSTSEKTDGILPQRIDIDVALIC